MRPVTLAEQQPVALLAGIDPRPQQAAQASKASAVADQDHRRGAFGQMEATVAPQTQVKGAIDWQVLGQPARTQAKVAVGVTLLAHDQLQHAIAGD
ncbi:hypothetical protein D3C81_1660190 [compost metagenome]